MATHDYVIANGTGAAVRSDLNNALAAIVSNNSGSSEPGTTYAYQWWADTNANVLKIRNSSNDGWITLRELDGTMLIEDGSASTPGLAFADDTNTGIFSGASDQIGFTTGGAERFRIETGEVVVNEPSNDVDFRVESNGNTHMLFVDAGNDRVGIGTSAPGDTFEVKAGFPVIAMLDSDTTNDKFRIVHNGGSTQLQVDPNNVSSSSHLLVSVDGSEAARIDSSGRLLAGTSTARSNVLDGDGGNTLTPQFQFETANSDTAKGLSVIFGRNNTNGAEIVLGKHRSASVGGTTVVNDGDQLGSLTFSGSDGTNFIPAATIEANVDATPGTNDMPGRLVFSTTADGASGPTERVRIGSDGMVELRADQGTAETNIIRFTDTDTSVAANQKFGQLQWFSNDSSGGGPCVKGEIYVIARDTTPDGDMVFATHDGSGTNTAENIRLISSGGITFNGDTAEANALDDYEEGTWTPRFVNNSNSDVNISAQPATRLGRYTKVGNRVFFNCWINGSLTTTETSSPIRIDGLPFNANSDSSAYASVSHWNYGGFSTYKDEIIVRNNTGGDQLFFQRYGADLTFDDIVKSGINMMFAGHYSI